METSTLKDIVIGVAGALIGALVIFLGGSAFGLYSKSITDSQLKEVSRLIVDEERYRETLLAKMQASKKFIGLQGKQGSTGKKGDKGDKGDKGESIWPKGKYCILRGNSSCPVDFKQIDSHLWGISVYATTPHVKSNIFGSSSIGLHEDGKVPKWYGNLNLSVCCK